MVQEKRLDTHSHLIYALGTIEEVSSDRKSRLTSKNLSDLLEIKPGSLRQYIAGLKKMRCLEKYSNRLGYIHYSLSFEGKEKYYEIKKEIENIEIIPEKHSISRRCMFNTIIPLLRNPLDRITVAKHVSRNKPFDLVEMVQQLNALAPESKERAMLREMIIGTEEDKESLEDVVAGFTLIGNKPGLLSKYEEMETSVDSLLILAELKRRRGEIEESRIIIDHLLTRREGLSTDKWIVCVLNMIQLILSLEGQEKALDIIDQTLSKLNNPAHIALIKKLEADIHSIRKEWEKATSLYKSCLGTFSAKQMHALQAITYNNMGVMFFRQGRFDFAEKNWLKARNLAHKHKLVWMKSFIEINLSDSYAKKGKIKRAKDMLRGSRKVMEEIGDMEGLSDVNFNQALVYIEEGNPNKALDFFKMTEDFPLIYNEKKMERREVFKERYQAKGWIFPNSI